MNDLDKAIAEAEAQLAAAQLAEQKARRMVLWFALRFFFAVAIAVIALFVGDLISPLARPVGLLVCILGWMDARCVAIDTARLRGLRP